MMAQEPVKTYLPHSIFASFFLFPFGIIALVFSILAESTKRDSPERAQAYAARAAHWGIAALGLWVVLLVAIFAFNAFFHGAAWL